MIKLRKTEEFSFDYSEEIKQSKKGFWGFVYEWVDSLMFAVLFILIIFTFLVRLVGVNGASMNPTLKDGDWLAVQSVNTTIDRGDIVIITQPNSLGKPLVKRVIAKGGDEIDIDFFDHKVTVNGQVLDEPYIAEPTSLMGNMVYPLKVPEGKVFVMGDNRNDSTDSREKHIGFIDEDYILGVAKFRLLPFDSFGGVN